MMKLLKILMSHKSTSQLCPWHSTATQPAGPLGRICWRYRLKELLFSADYTVTDEGRDKNRGAVKAISPGKARRAPRRAERVLG
jgi:hypothetical protein